MPKKINQKRLKMLVSYHENGVLRRRMDGMNIAAGDVLGGKISSHGYLRAHVDGELYYVHRLVWIWHHGYSPENDIDHIDKNKLNNKIENLRAVSRSCNLRNTGNRKNNTSNVKGVNFDKNSGKWHSKIYFNHKRFYLGCFNDFYEAVCYRLAAEQCLGWSGCDCSSPAYKYIKKNKG